MPRLARELPGDPLYITVRNFDRALVEIEGTPFAEWIYSASVVWLINQRGNCLCIKDCDGMNDGRRCHIEELLLLEEILTHDQFPVRQYGLRRRSRC